LGGGKERVLSMYHWNQVKLLKEKGYSIKQIVKELKISRNTIRKYLRSKKPPEFHAREYESKILKYDKEIKEMIVKEFIGTRIYSELIKLGYSGSLATIYRYLQKQERKKDTKVTTSKWSKS
jgi:predicted transcriptional regulator